jgi:hypothetical protein
VEPVQDPVEIEALPVARNDHCWSRAAQIHTCAFELTAITADGIEGLVGTAMQAEANLQRKERSPLFDALARLPKRPFTRCLNRYTVHLTGATSFSC